MKKQQNISLYVFLITLFVVILSIVSLQPFIFPKNNFDTRSKAAGNSFAVCPSGCQYSGAAGLQQAIDAAQNGDIINIGGMISGSTQMVPFEGRMNVQSCFVDLRGKNLTLKGGMLWGEGHDKGAHDSNDPLYHRAGICSKGGQITIDGTRIKEFEGGGMQFFDATVILKNSTIDGSDHGGIFLFDSSILALNNLIVRNIGFIPFRNSSIKAYNNIFWWGKAIVAAVSCNDNVPPIDFVNNIIVDPELTIGIGGLSTSCPEKVAQFKTKNIAYNVQWKEGRDCYKHEYCDPYTGKITADPQFAAPVNDPRGIAAWADFSLKPGSPAISAGSPDIPGGRNLGISGGPCSEPSSSTCNDFIARQVNLLAPTQPPTVETPASVPFSPVPQDTPAPISLNPTNPNPAFPNPTSSSQTSPPISYYLPPTMGFDNPNSNTGNTTSIDGIIIQPTPTITSAPQPLIDVVKTVENAKSTWNNFITSFINFTKTILP